MIAKVLYIVTQSEFGGAQRSILDLASGIRKRKYEVTVAAGGGRGDFFDLLHQEHIRAVQLRHIQRGINPWFDALGVVELYRLLRKEKPDIVHLNSTKVGILGSIAAYGSKIFFDNPKIVFTARGWVFNEELPFWRKRLYVYAEKVASLLRDAVVCVSQFDYQTAVRYAITPVKTLTIIHNGIDTKVIRFLSREEARSRLLRTRHPDTIVVGAIANLYYNKGIDLLIRAAAIVGRERQRVVFVVIGEGSQRKQLEWLIARLNLKQVFFLVGSITDARVYLKAFDVFVLSSRKEGFPHAILEAGAAGLPIVATDVGGVPEIVSNGLSGILVSRNNVEQLAAGIRVFAENNALRESMGRRLQQQVQAFSIENMVAQTSVLYDSLRNAK